MSVAFCQEKKRADTGYCSRMCRLQLNRIDLIVWLRRSVALVQSDTDATISAEAICRSCCPARLKRPLPSQPQPSVGAGSRGGVTPSLKYRRAVALITEK